MCYVSGTFTYFLLFLSEILFASLNKCQSLLETSIAVPEEDALKKFHYINAFGLEKFCASIQQLPKLIQEHPNVSKFIYIVLTFW